MADGSLERFIGEVTGESHLRVEEDLGGGFVRLRVSEAERRQAKQDIRCCEDIVLELLRNSRDAGSHLIFVATAREGAYRKYTVIDDGAGIPEHLWERVFEPRVTGKLDAFTADTWGVHGRGMALYSIACNSEEHRVLASAAGKGTAIHVKADTGLLPEKADQSSYPRFIRDDDGRMVARGPRNINRIVAEFTVSQKAGCLVYLGSPVEILATLVRHGRRALSLVERAFADDCADYPLCLRPSLAASPEELAEIASQLGLDLSARSARRVLDGEIRELPPFMNALAASGAIERRDADAPCPPANGRTRKKLVLADEDRSVFSQYLKDAYRNLANAYYLEADVEPRIRVTRDEILVAFPLMEAE